MSTTRSETDRWPPGAKRRVARFYVSLGLRGWEVIRRVGLFPGSSGDVVCRHGTRESARACAHGRNGRPTYGELICDPTVTETNDD